MTLLGKTGLGEYGRPGTIALRKRVFSKVSLFIVCKSSVNLCGQVDPYATGDDDKPSVINETEDLSGQLRQYEGSWRIVEKIVCGLQEADRSLRPLHTSLLNQGDFVDVLATLTVPLTRGTVGQTGDLMIEPKRILRLRTSLQVAVRAFTLFKKDIYLPYILDYTTTPCERRVGACPLQKTNSCGSDCRRSRNSTSRCSCAGFASKERSSRGLFYTVGNWSHAS